jgi:hypothetical protein
MNSQTRGLIGMTIAIGVFLIATAAVNPWRPLNKRDQLRHPIAIAAWWTWALTLAVLLVFVWCRPLQTWYDRWLSSVQIK